MRKMNENNWGGLRNFFKNRLDKEMAAAIDYNNLCSYQDIGFEDLFGSEIEQVFNEAGEHIGIHIFGLDFDISDTDMEEVEEFFKEIRNEIYEDFAK